MNDSLLLPLFIVITLVVMAFAGTIITTLIMHKQRQVRGSLERQRLEFEYCQALQNTRIEVQETTLNMLAEELHDNLQQVFSACYSQVVTVESMIDDQSGKQILQQAGLILKSGISDLRLLSHNLATGLVEHREIEEVIQAELARIQAFSHISCNLRALSLYELPPEHKLLLFRIIQEALQNALKHAAAKHIDILIEETDHHYIVVIKDDGKGYLKTDVERDSSLGLMNMQHRAHMMNAKLDILSAPGCGTSITIQIPIHTA